MFRKKTKYRVIQVEKHYRGQSWKHDDVYNVKIIEGNPAVIQYQDIKGNTHYRQFSKEIYSIITITN